MTRLREPRRHADGALGIDHHRRRARRLRHVARRQAGRIGRRAVPAEAPPPGGFAATALHVAPLEASPWWIFRRHGVRLGRGAMVGLGRGAMSAPALPIGDVIVPVAEGSIIIEVEGGAPRLLHAGQALQCRPLAPHVARNGSGGLPAVLIVRSVAGVGLPAGMPLAGPD